MDVVSGGVGVDSGMVYGPLQKVVDGTVGLVAAVVSDLDGVGVVTAVKKGSEMGSKVATGSMESVSIAAELAELGEKMHMGSCRSIVEYLDDAVVVYCMSSLLITKLVGEKGANVGLILARADDIERVMLGLANVLQETPAPAQGRMFED